MTLANAGRPVLLRDVAVNIAPWTALTAWTAAFSFLKKGIL
jgi:hypothetical protein